MDPMHTRATQVEGRSAARGMSALSAIDSMGSMSQGRSSVRGTQRGPSPAWVGGREINGPDSCNPDLREVTPRQGAKEELDARQANRKRPPAGRRDPPDPVTGAHFMFGHLGLALLAAKTVRSKMVQDEGAERRSEPTLRPSAVNAQWKQTSGPFSNAYRSINDTYIATVFSELERSYNHFHGQELPAGKSMGVCDSSPATTPRAPNNAGAGSDTQRETLQMDVKNL